MFVEECDGNATTVANWDPAINYDSGSSPAPVLADSSGVAYFDLLEIWFTLTWDHRYIPVSLAVVPVVSVALGAVLVFALRSIWPSRAAPAPKLET